MKHESWGPVIRAIIENQSSPQATSTILALLPAMLLEDASPAPPTETPKPTPTPSPAPTPRRASAAATPAPTPTPAFTGDPPAGLKSKTLANGQLDPFAYFTPDEAATFLGVGRERIYQILRTNPETLPHQKEGREYKVRGRELEAFRKQRAERAAAKAEGKDDGSDDDEEEDEDRDESQDEGARSIY